jgi:molybdenum cofactor cytidylyltransferase
VHGFFSEYQSGFSGDHLPSKLSTPKVPVFGEGCSSSYRAGIGAIDEVSDAIMILLGDQPGVNPEIINRVAEVFRERDCQIVLASYRGRKGHPMLFARPLFNRLVDLHGDKAVWKLLGRRAGEVTEVAVPGPVPPDVDTWEDYEAALAAVGAAR